MLLPAVYTAYMEGKQEERVLISGSMYIQVLFGSRGSSNFDGERVLISGSIYIQVQFGSRGSSNFDGEGYLFRGLYTYNNLTKDL